MLQYSLTASAYAQPAGDLLLIRPRVLGRDARPFNDKPRIYPIDLGETGTWRDSIDVALPADYAVDDMPAAVNLDVGFVSYKSEVKASGVFSTIRASMWCASSTSLRRNPQT